MDAAWVLDDPSFRKWPLPFGALRRRSSWPSIKEHTKVRDTPFFKSWHEEVWQMWLSHGLVPIEGSEGGVELATPPWAEAAVFGELTGLREGWSKLPEITIPIGFIMGNDPRTTGGATATAEMVWRPPRARNEVVPDGGHLVSDR